MRDVSPRILAAIRRYARNDADAQDLLQDCWVHILDRLDQFRRNQSFAAWAIAVSKNVCRKKWRGRRRKRAGLEQMSLERVGEVADSGPDPEVALIQRQQGDVLSAALDRLSNRERDAVVLRLVQGLGTADTAVQMGVSPRAVSAALHRAIEALRRMPAVRKLLMEWMGAD